MADEHKISLRTAYRHLARGTTPASDRRIGVDGKTYPAQLRKRRPGRTPLERELALTRQALNRADKKAGQQDVDGGDVEALRRIVSTTNEILSRWEGVHSDGKLCPDKSSAVHGLESSIDRVTPPVAGN
jgi:hypothetical protein